MKQRELIQKSGCLEKTLKIFKISIEVIHLTISLVEEFCEAESDKEIFFAPASNDQMIRQIFLKHFENFLGSTYPVQEIESSETLDLFDIKDTKAHGPDGFTAAFFKQAWSIVGADTCTAA
ncbi:hypothetical protein Tco_1355988 [Tanacetum coccineum]